MLAYIPALLLAATAAALPESASGIVSRSALSAMSVQQAAEKCDPKEHLVCCNKSEECEELDLGRISRPDFLYEHCTATVACCDFKAEIEHSKNWGDIYESCTYIGSL